MNLTYLRLYDLKLFITHQHAETHPLSQYIALRSLLLGWGERNTKVEDTVQFNRYLWGTYQVTGTTPGIMNKTATTTPSPAHSPQTLQKM